MEQFTESSHDSVEYKESYDTFMSRHIFYNKSLHDKGEIISCAFKLQIKWNRKPFAWQERYDEGGSPQVWQGKYIYATMHK